MKLSQIMEIRACIEDMQRSVREMGPLLPYAQDRDRIAIERALIRLETRMLKAYDRECDRCDRQRPGENPYAATETQREHNRALADAAALLMHDNIR